MSKDAAHDKIGHTIRDMIARSKKAESNSSIIKNQSLQKENSSRRSHLSKKFVLNFNVINLILLLIMTSQPL